MQRTLLFALLFAQATSYDADVVEKLNTLLEDASLLLHNLSRQHLLWQCNATLASSDARRLASCQQATRGEAVVLKLPTIDSLVELLSRLALPNAVALNIAHKRRSTRQDQVGIVHRGLNKLPPSPPHTFP